jgi:hypothetical protein
MSVTSLRMLEEGVRFVHWIPEAKRLMEARPKVMVCNPHPGPPTADGRPRSQTLTPEPYSSVAFRASHINTRVVFFASTTRLGLQEAIYPQSWFQRRQNASSVVAQHAR